MNMLLHGIGHADIRQEDTDLAEDGELKRYDRVLANPPFSQNYIRKEIDFPGRFHVFMPEKGKKADLMFVQHMLATLNADGKMATIMPHGVLFRGGEEATARRHFLERGYLEAIIGLPANLFYGTGIPACILVMNKKGAVDRKNVLFINADRKYRDGKAQNFLRPEDIDKIVHTYRSMQDVPGYARLVSKDVIAGEEYNCNIRRYVDNAPPPEPHDVRAHIHGGVPITEIDALGRFWSNYTGLRAKCFQTRANDPRFSDFTSELTDQRRIAEIVGQDSSVRQRHTEFLAEVEAWWLANVARIEQLAPKNGDLGNVYALRRELLASVSDALRNQSLLNAHQVRGAFANYVDDLKADLKSIAASGWGPELIPDDDIVQSQFPEVLEQLEGDRARLAELQSLFAATKEEDFEDIEETGVLPEDQAKTLREEKKKLDDEWKRCVRELESRIENLSVELRPTGQLPRGAAKSYYTEGLSPREPDFDHIDRICIVATAAGGFDEDIRQIEDLARSGTEALDQAREIENRNGEGFLYLGSSYRLRLVQGQEEPLILKDGRFQLRRSVAEKGVESAKPAFRSFYIAKGYERLERRTLSFASRVGVQVAGVTVKELGYRWASCSGNGAIRFHWKTMMAPPKVIDYVIVHELCHLHHRDHDDAFWNEVDKVMPDYAERKAWLRENGAGLDV